ncbi:6-pyruvoyl trahydropterin synthase family protein [Cryptosporangium phraense]|uniref:6-carboxy-5,6,7,8-tetrahydropterin synthase n=1 Tax=Cryptosporangium phraense TaxID=2593070 RepID=A0A545AN75_9ACTN|nr:6-carboxytetrahydropterin synthase [Cryptosporangium phraense]TQS42789.1 6-carboxytetrahydropterin synthase [Cryptosporangium phraense]
MSRYAIGKSFAFSASHQLPGLPEGHQCGRLHGHNYTVEVELEAETLEFPGFVTDFGDLAPFKAYLDATFDHRHLNDVLDEPPTSERLAAHLATWLERELLPQVGGRLVSVRVSETPTSWAKFSPSPGGGS